MGVAPITRFRCAYPGCEKRYSSTDGVRKHAKKSHSSWIKSIDALLEGGGRQAMLEGAGLSKPSTYSIRESGDSMELDEANEPTPLTTTVKRLSSTGDVLLEQVRSAGVTRLSSEQLPRGAASPQPNLEGSHTAECRPHPTFTVCSETNPTLPVCCRCRPSATSSSA